MAELRRDWKRPKETVKLPFRGARKLDHSLVCDNLVGGQFRVFSFCLCIHVLPKRA